MFKWMLFKISVGERLVTRCMCVFFIYPQGCTLKSDKREFKVDVDDDDTEQQLSLKAVRPTISSARSGLKCQNYKGLIGAYITLVNSVRCSVMPLLLSACLLFCWQET